MCPVRKHGLPIYQPPSYSKHVHKLNVDNVLYVQSNINNTKDLP